MVAVVQWLLVLALLVVHSQGEQAAYILVTVTYIATLTGQSEGITGLVDNSTLTEWGLFTGTSNLFLRQDPGSVQFLFPGLRFQCSGNVTKWIIGAGFNGIYREYPTPCSGDIQRPARR